MLRGYPPQIKFIVGNEAAERYSYYGMRAILVVYMIKFLAFPKDHAVETYHMFAAGCYLFPLLGAYLSDRWLGKYRTIMSLSLVYCLGHLLLSLFSNSAGMYWGLFFIALGSGGIKPCVSANVGDQFVKGQEEKMSRIFALFYWMINFGATFASLITPWTYDKYGPGIAFGIPGILMFIATVIFWMGRKHYVYVPPVGKDPHSFGKVTFGALKRWRGKNFWQGALAKHSVQAVDAAKAVWGIIILYVWVSVFWSLFDQNGSTWVIQAQHMNLRFAGITWNEAQIQAINPILILLLIPVFSTYIYPWVEKRGIRVTPIRKMCLGMFVAASSFMVIAMLQARIEAGVQVNVAWQFFPYLLITIAEILVSITGLEFAYTQAPRTMKSTIMSFWLVTVFIGNILTAELSKINIYPVASTSYFNLFAILMLGIAMAFTIVAYFYKERNYMEI